MFSHLHTTREGKTTLVAQLDTFHLLNTIRLALRIISQVVEASHKPVSIYSTKLYGRRTADPSDAVRLVNETLERMAPYFIELALRAHEADPGGELDDLRLQVADLLAKIAGREGQMPEDDLPFLNSDNDDDEDDWGAN